MSAKTACRIRMICGAALIALLAVPCVVCEDRNVTGRWALSVETPQGKADPLLDLRQDGEKLSGTYKGRLGEFPLEGSVKGNAIRFTVRLKFREQDFTAKYSGTIGSDTMEGTVQFGDSGTGKWSGRRQR